VLARSGERVHLRHERVGGKLFTTRAWIEEFGRRLAEADAAHFSARVAEPAPERPAPGRAEGGRQRDKTPASPTRCRGSNVEAALDEEGL
jgi:hypothetical protein